MRQKRIILILVILACLLFTTSVMAMTSPNFEIGWLVPLTGGGGSVASSENYAVHLTIGQTAVGASASTNFQAGLGFWRGVGETIWRLLLPHTLQG
jgi:hypothetical protein